MTPPSAAPSRYRIVIALDRSEYAEIVLEHGLDQAARHDAPDLHVLTVLEGRGGRDARGAEGSAELEAAKAWLATRVLEGLETFRAGRPDWRTRLHVRAGKPAEEIVDLAGQVKADLLVVGRYGLHGRSSIAERIVARASCPTLVVGLSGEEVEAEAPCPACAELREASDGERWFCDAHADPDRLHLSTRVSGPGSLTHGGPLW